MLNFRVLAAPDTRIVDPHPLVTEFVLASEDVTEAEDATRATARTQAALDLPNLMPEMQPPPSSPPNIGELAARVAR